MALLKVRILMLCVIINKRKKNNNEKYDLKKNTKRQENTTKSGPQGPSPNAIQGQKNPYPRIS
jgi:hypothetical protein